MREQAEITAAGESLERRVIDGAPVGVGTERRGLSEHAERVDGGHLLSIFQIRATWSDISERADQRIYIHADPAQLSLTNGFPLRIAAPAPMTRVSDTYYFSAEESNEDNPLIVDVKCAGQ
jgi:hypothetical protein